MKNSSTKKLFSIIGIIASIALVLAGIVVLTSFFGAWETRHVSYPYGTYGTTYDYGYAVFGADFYNYVSNNAGMAGYGAQAAAGNLSEIFEMLRFAIGVSMICFGLGGFAAFGVILAGAKTKEEKTAAEPFVFPAPAAADPVVPAPERTEEAHRVPFHRKAWHRSRSSASSSWARGRARFRRIDAG